MKISLENIGKRYQRHRIFRDISHQFSSPRAYALLGANGSGKSTLLRIIAGMQPPSIGKVHYEADDKTISVNKIFPYISFCAPGMEIVEELTLREFLAFHFSFKKPLQGLDTESIIKLTGLCDSADKPISDYSSGMKQRAKLAQAIFSDTPALLLDEPCSNLDQQGVEQYKEWMRIYAGDRLTIIASNDVREYYFCGEQIILEDHK